MAESNILKNLFGLEGKVALVTGGGRGIGRMAAQALVEAGAKVYIVSRRKETIDEAVKEMSEYGEVIGLTADFQSAEACREFAAEFAKLEDKLDILVNNSGATWGHQFGDFPIEAWDKVFNLNVRAPYFLTEGLAPLLEKAATQDDPARVINIGSVGGLRAGGGIAYPYGPSKAAIHHLSKGLANTLGPKFITVNAIAPGPFPSKMMAETLEKRGDEIAASRPAGRVGRPDDIAGTVLFLCGRGGSYINAAVIPVDGGGVGAN